MRKFNLLFLPLLLLVLAACGSNEANEAVNIKELVHEYSVGDFSDDVQASIDSHELVVNENGKEKRYDLPEDEFFVSIAPFETYTHECAIHSLTGCQGELVKEEMTVKITDSSGDLVIDDTITTLENGFIDLWLPRDDEYTVFIEKDGKTSEQMISTNKGDYTCVTTMQLL